MTHDEAKQQVAEKHGYGNFGMYAYELLWGEAGSSDQAYAEAAELYARNLANEKVREYKIFSLPGQQSFIFGHITNEFKSTGEISQNTGLLSKNVSVQLHNIMSVGGLIEMKQEGKLKYWKLL